MKRPLTRAVSLYDDSEKCHIYSRGRVAVWIDLLVVSVALLPWLAQNKAKRGVVEALTLAAETQAEPAVLPHQAPEF
jgi:hypothetical protein